MKGKRGYLPFQFEAVLLTSEDCFWHVRRLPNILNYLPRHQVSECTLLQSMEMISKTAQAKHSWDRDDKEIKAEFFDTPRHTLYSGLSDATFGLCVSISSSYIFLFFFYSDISRFRFSFEILQANSRMSTRVKFEQRNFYWKTEKSKSYACLKN